MSDQPADHQLKPGDISASTKHDARHIGDRLASSAALLWATTMLLRCLQLVTTAILARILSPSDFGIVAIAMIVVGFLDILSNLQVGGVIVKTKDLTKQHLDTAFTLNLIRGGLSALAMVLLASPVSVYMHEPKLKNILYVLAIPALVGGLHNPHFLLFARNLNFSQDSKRDALAAIIGSLAGIVVAIIFRSYWALVISSMMSGLIWTLLSYWRVPGKPGFSLSKSSEMLSYGSWLILISALDYVNLKVDFLLIGRQIGSSALGAYNVGQTLTSTATGDVVTALSRALFPAFSILSDDLGRLRVGYRQIQSITLALALPIGFGMSALSGDIVLLLVGKKWALAIPVIKILAPLVALQTMTASIESLALSMNKGGMLFWRTAIFFVFRVGLMFAGFYLGGFMGIVYARVISGSALLLYSLALAARITKSHMLDPIKSSWRSFISVAVMWCGVTQWPSPNIWTLPTIQLAALLIGKIALGGVLYIGTHVLLWIAAGKPVGTEQRLLEQMKRIFGLFKTKSAV